MYSIDIETRSKTDIKLGIHKYVNDTEFMILIAAVKNLNTGKIEMFDFYHDGISQRWVDIVTGDEIKWAFNAAFEQICIEAQLGIQTYNWHCKMVHSYLNGASGTLDGVNLLFGTNVKKNPEGKRLIKQFSIDFVNPDDYPYDWDLFKSYCTQDVEAEAAIQCPYNIFDTEMYELHHKINSRGVSLDLNLVNRNLIACEKIKEQAELKIKALGLENPRSFKQKLLWFAKHGVTMKSTDKDHLKELQATTQNTIILNMIELLQQVSSTSTSKYKKMQEANIHGKIYDLFRMAMAGTHRFSSVILQLQNFARGYGSEAEIEEAMKNIDSLEKSKNLLRACIVGNLMVADFSGIEARVLAWLAQDVDKLDKIRNGIDLYKVNAAKLYNVNYNAVTKPQRGAGKTMELALGYQGAVNAMVAFGADKIFDTENDIVKAVKLWRKMNPKVSQLWYHIEDVARLAITTCQGYFINEDLNWYMDYKRNLSGKYDLLMHLPNGVFLVYKNARYVYKDGKKQLAYDKNHGNLVKNEFLYGGKLVENATQAVAYQLLRSAMLNLDKYGFNIVAHVHDEIIVDGHDNNLQEMIKLMTELPNWAKLGSCGSIPLDAEGWIGNRYKK